jgi:hypothetical protein
MARKSKNVAEKKNIKRKNTWKIPGIIAKMRALIIEGVLAQENGYKKAFEIIKKEFIEKLSLPEYSFNQRSFCRKANELIWSEPVLRQLRDAIRNGMDLERVQKQFSYIPEGQFRFKWNELKGRSPKRTRAEFIRGIGRLSSQISQFSETPPEFPRHSFKHPYRISTDRGRPFVSFLNGVNLGVPFSKVIEENVARQELLHAESNNVAAVVLTNMLDIRFVKASGAGLSVHRARISGREINPGVFDESYAKEVAHILERRPANQLIYQTLAETFLDSLAGWRKITVDRETPVFSGKVVVVLGYKEEAMIDTAAYWECHYYWRMRLNELEVVRSALKYQLREIVKENISSANEQRIRQELEDIEEKIARTRMSNVSEWDFQRAFNRVLNFVITKIQEAIPNSVVIGMGTSFIALDGKIIEVNIPRHTRSGSSTDRLLRDYCNTAYGPKVLRREFADAVVICHPYALNWRWTKRENDHDGKRGDSDVHVAPIAIDRKRFYEVAKDYIRTVPGIAKSVFMEQFEPGVLTLHLINGTLQPSCWGNEALQDLTKKLSKSGGRTSTHCKYIWIFMATDTHIGNAGREHVIMPDGRMLGSVEATFELMRREGLMEDKNFPIHMITFNDDPTQGHNFPTQQRVHPNEMPYMELEAWMREKEQEIQTEKSAEKRSLLLTEMRSVALRQIMLRGKHWTSDQVELFVDMVIAPNVDFFDALLKRALRSGLKITGLSEISGELTDQRDPGFVHFGTGGHHFHNTTDGEMLEGPIYARILQGLLSGLSYWRGKESLLKQLIRAPRMSNQSIAWGLIGLPGGFRYALDIRDFPAKMEDWGDPIGGWPNVDMRRGNYGRHMSGTVTVKLCGDKHFGAAVKTPWGWYVMGLPNTPTDQYAEGHGAFPPNNTGVMFVGLPVGGPDTGPMLTRPLTFQRMQSILENNEPFDWKEFLPNPV